MPTRTIPDLATAIERLTDVRVDLNHKALKGRNVWARVAFRQTGMVHVEIMPGDQQVNDAVMLSISADDMQLSGEQRKVLYRTHCKELASELNARAIAENQLILFIASNGHPTRTAKALIEALL